MRIVNDEYLGLHLNFSTVGFPIKSLCSNSFMASSYCLQIDVHAVTQSPPSSTISCIQSLPHAAEVSRITNADSSSDGLAASKLLKDIHISSQLMEDFLALAGDNTSKDLETCGVLGAFLEGGTFYVTTLIIPKQESSSNSCQARNEEEIFTIQNEQSLFPVGWIHTHPSQSCFMSSIDLHTQYSYQAMLPEAVAIVMAPTDTTRSYGIFRLSDPGGMNILKECRETGYHCHSEPSDGSPVYEHCSNIYVNPNLRLEIYDLR
ncbi:AMSH-like ubiquitin thioesterase 2 isoform X6 [Actinidia eriantha]|uniref:AMSH-like ubiquitin thioesterase 2 isoform X6 n=1 Tax=Actinidia eriantha TaxID=165200 RepID=UPI0025870693|nr:AMSH-like ubiquitin thioesterase 2 isoform X6 [Actinidia eriantha]XP_057508637.1 AMSH-like ubiquitin thioesterase 2 isoform X6 [Actinidia eriantha]